MENKSKQCICSPFERKNHPNGWLKKIPILSILNSFLFGGAWGIQTPDLINANDALYQLS